MSTLPEPPANIAQYVEILGVDATFELVMTFGGSELYFPANPKGKSALEKLIGPEKMRALVAAAPHLKARVPTAKPWLTAVLKSKGLSNAEIARRLRITDVTVRRHLEGTDLGRPDPSDQLSLF